jgi:hypothetical protein
VRATGWFGLHVAVVLCLAGTVFSNERTKVQKDIPGRLETLAAAGGTCELEDDSGCAPPAQVQNRVAALRTEMADCKRLADVRGVSAVSWGGGIAVFTEDSMIHIFDDGIDGNVRSMAEALRPVSGPADVTKPLPAPSMRNVRAIDEWCGAAP